MNYHIEAFAPDSVLFVLLTNGDQQSHRMSEQTKALLYQRETQIYLGKKSPFLPRSTKQEISDLHNIQTLPSALHSRIYSFKKSVNNNGSKTEKPPAPLEMLNTA